ncbi:MAG: hypothetical protein GTO24_21180 [candidate division Zixibacteria bacterium]|nr:hypothetical protein [candidate division Zixibacteria bacterium]
MHKAIQVRRESRRGCGWRKVGGLYLMGMLPAKPCGRLPIPCETCPCCGRGIKPARGWTWVDADEIIRAAPECKTKKQCRACIVERVVKDMHALGRAGLIWIGEKHYPTVGHFNRESDLMGISRRLSSIPNDFELGKTYVLLAHRRAIIEGEVKIIEGGGIEFKPGIFAVFKPTHIEIVVKGDEPDDVIEGYLKRGLTPIMIEKIEDIQEKLFDAA